MGGRNLPLNPTQIEVLIWVRDGCAPGVYEDWAHRITARALHNRGLVVVKGRGTGWAASLTDDGTFYLDYGEYPGVQESPLSEAHRPPLAAADEEPTPRRPQLPFVANRTNYRRRCGLAWNA